MWTRTELIADSRTEQSSLITTFVVPSKTEFSFRFCSARSTGPRLTPPHPPYSFIPVKQVGGVKWSARRQNTAQQDWSTNTNPVSRKFVKLSRFLIYWFVVWDTFNHIFRVREHENKTNVLALPMATNSVFSHHGRPAQTPPRSACDCWHSAWWLDDLFEAESLFDWQRNERISDLEIES